MYKLRFLNGLWRVLSVTSDRIQFSSASRKTAREWLDANEPLPMTAHDILNKEIGYNIWSKPV
jgi:hypothetical protein